MTVRSVRSRSPAEILFSVLDKPNVCPDGIAIKESPMGNKPREGPAGSGSVLGHAAVPLPPRLGQTLHFVWRLSLLFPTFLFPSRVLVRAAVVEAGQYGRVKHFLQVLLGQGGALHIGYSSHLYCTLLRLCRLHGSLPELCQVNQNLNGGGQFYDKL